MPSSIDQQFIEYIVKSLVGHPDAVKIERRIDEKGVLLELIVDPEDLGRVIGKRGATAQSLRTLLRALGTKNDARYNLKIIDVGGPAPSKSSSADDSQPASDDAAVSDSTDEPVENSEESGKPEDVGSATDDDTAEEEKPESSSSSLADRTRAELADLDDLDL
jgi:predicted RNA-binding protein YlqC (UPF0109 family)